MSTEWIEPGDVDDMTDGLVKRFREAHRVEPKVCALAPGRVNLIGEHVDYNGGECLPLALPHATYAAVSARSDRRVTIASRQQAEAWEGHLDRLGPGQVEGWVSYVAGVVWALRETGVDTPGLDIVVDSTVPVGAGLSSSAALECSVAVAVCELVGLDLTDRLRDDLVQACMRAEAEVAGAPTGGMDQTISLLAQRDHALLLDCRDWSTTQVPWGPAAHGLDLLVIDTRASHELTDGGYASRREDCESAARTLGVPTLREVTDADAALSVLEDDKVRRRVRHVLSEMERVRESVRAIKDDDLSSFGALLDGSHESLRTDFEVSCAELDVAVETSRAHGALGARMTGGGFGGSAIALVPTASVSSVAEAVAAAFDERGWKAPGFLMAQASERARVVRRD